MEHPGNTRVLAHYQWFQRCTPYRILTLTGPLPRFPCPLAAVGPALSASNWAAALPAARTVTAGTQFAFTLTPSFALPCLAREISTFSYRFVVGLNLNAPDAVAPSPLPSAAGTAVVRCTGGVYRGIISLYQATIYKAVLLYDGAPVAGFPLTLTVPGAAPALFAISPPAGTPILPSGQVSFVAAPSSTQYVFSVVGTDYHGNAYNCSVAATVLALSFTVVPAAAEAALTAAGETALGLYAAVAIANGTLACGSRGELTMSTQLASSGPYVVSVFLSGRLVSGSSLGVLVEPAVVAPMRVVVGPSTAHTGVVALGSTLAVPLLLYDALGNAVPCNAAPGAGGAAALVGTRLNGSAMRWMEDPAAGAAAGVPSRGAIDTNLTLLCVSCDDRVAWPFAWTSLASEFCDRATDALPAGGVGAGTGAGALTAAGFVAVEASAPDRTGNVTLGLEWDGVALDVPASARDVQVISCLREKCCEGTRKPERAKRVELCCGRTGCEDEVRASDREGIFF